MKPPQLLFCRRPILLALAAALMGFQGLEPPPLVRAVLFFAPTCPHCHKVIQQDLPRIFAANGGEARVYYDEGLAAGEIPVFDVSNGQIEILLVDVSVPLGAELYHASTDRYQVPDERQGVPRLVIDDTVLVGSLEIPTLLPRFVEEAREGERIDWPDISGLQVAVASIPGRPLATAETPPADGPAAAAADEAGANTDESRPDRHAETVTDSLDAGAEAASPAAVESEPRKAEVEPQPREAEAASEPREAEADPDGARSGESVTGSEVDVTPSATEGPSDHAERAEEGEPTLAVIPERRATMIENYRRDPVGNSVSVIVLIGMILSVVVAAYVWQLPSDRRDVGLGIPVISLVGIGVAAYLSYIETSGVTAVCGPVGDCNTVNQSEYARLFGALPVGLLGLVGYVAIIATWFVARLDGQTSDWAKVALLAMTGFGVLFSIYLTFLEPFVIGATCAWCLTSAVVMTILMALSVRPAAEAWTRLRRAARPASG